MSDNYYSKQLVKHDERKLEDIYFSLELIDGEIIPVCFIEEETDDLLIIARWISENEERIKIINKAHIKTIKIIYLANEPKNKKESEKEHLKAYE